jgi:CubicO group peptidase (beta-lactamase class C family)
MRTHTLRLKISAVLGICAVVLVHRSAAGTRQLEGGRAMMLRAIPEAVGMSSERLQLATAVLRQFVADHKIAGAVAGVARRGKIVYLEPVGLQDRETRTPMTERSLFRIYSMTKAVTAVGVMMLVEEGKLHLTDPASKFLPEFKNMIVQEITVASSPRKPSREITIQDLLLHTSGLSHRTSDLYQNLKVRSRSIGLPQFITNITNAPLMEDPGTRFRYSEATTVLGRIIEVVSKQPFDTFVINRILKPLGMNDTMFWADANAKSRLTTLYQGNDEGALTAFENEDVPFTRKPALLEGAVGLLSTAEDFLKFSQMLLNNGELNGTRLLTTETVASMTVNALPDSVLATKGGVLGWGLANVDVVVGRTSRGYLTSIGEYGWDGSIGTFFAVDPSRELVVILMTQNVPANPDSLRQKFKAAVVQSIVQ